MSSSTVKRVGLILALLLSTLPGAVGAQAPPIVVDAQAVTPQFPTRIVFSLTAHEVGAGTIRRAEVAYQVHGDPYTWSVVAALTPAARVATTATVDTQIHYIPPGVSVDYYWTLEDAAGQRFDTAHGQFRYDDGRFAWQTRAAGNVHLHWHVGGAALGSALAGAADSGLAKLAAQTNLTLTEPAEVWVYADSDELRSAMPPNQPEWVGGQAFPAESVVVAQIADDANADSEARRILPHELAHLAVHTATLNPYNAPPIWLNEGIAVTNQEDGDPSFSQLVKQAARARALLPLRTLEASFPADPDQAALSYAESAGAVQFLLDRYGSTGVYRLLTTFQQGVTYDDALQQALGLTTDQLDAQWRTTLPAPNGPAATATVAQPPAAQPPGTVALPTRSPTPDAAPPVATAPPPDTPFAGMAAGAVALWILAALVALGAGSWWLWRRGVKRR